MKMRIQSILNEQHQQNTKYDPLINGVTSLVWEKFIEMQGKPINESVYNQKFNSLRSLVFQTAVNMDDKQTKRFLKTLESPSNEVLLSGLEYRFKGEEKFFESSALCKAMEEIFPLNEEEYKVRDEKDKHWTVRAMNRANDAKKAVMAGTLGKVVKGAGDLVGKGIKAFADTRLGKIVSAGIKAITKWVGEKLAGIGAFLASKMKPIIDFLKKKGEQETKLCGDQELQKNSLMYYGDPLNEAKITDDQGNIVDTENPFYGNFDISKLKAIMDDKTNMDAINAFKFTGGQGKAPEETKIANAVAKTIALMKQKEVVIKGADLRTILQTVGKAPTDKITFMSQWYEDNNMADMIAAAEGKPLPSMVATDGSIMCDVSFDTMKVVNDEMSKGMGAINSPEFKASWGTILLNYAKNNKVSTFLALAGIASTLFLSPLGLLRIGSMIFASIIPIIIDAKITHLKAVGAPNKQIYFWEDAKTAAQFIANVFAVFNIASWATNGWEAATTDLDNIKDGVTDLDISADQAKLDSLLNKYPVADGFKYSAGAGGTIAIYNDAGEQVFNGMIPLKSMSADGFAQMANNNQNIAPMSVGTGAQSGIESAVKDGSDLVSFDKLDTVAQERFVNLVNGTGVTGVKSAAALETLQKAFNNPDIMDNMSNQQFTKIQDVLMHDMPGVDAELADNARAALIKRVLVDKTFTLDALNGLSPEKQEYFLEYMARNDGAIPKSVWGDLTAAETASKEAAAALKDTTDTPSTEIPAAAAKAPFTIEQEVEINGKVGTVEEIATNDAGTKFYKIKNKDGTEEWIPAENTPNAVTDAAVENTTTTTDFHKNFTDFVGSSKLSDDNKRILQAWIKDPANTHPVRTAKILYKIVNDTEQMNILNSMEKLKSAEYLETLGQFDFTPKNIIDFNIKDQLMTTNTLKLMKANGFDGWSSKDLLSTLQSNGIDVNSPDAFEDIKKLKDITDAKPTLSA